MAVPVETRPATDRDCPRCGSPAAAFQEYCLECGARLPPDPAAPAPRPRLGAALWPVLATGVIALLAAAIVVAVQLADDDGSGRLGVTATAPIPPAPATTGPPEAVLTTVPEPPPPPPAQTQPAGDRVVSWPEGRSGWTVVIASLPESQGRQAATTKAREVLDAGLSPVGVLVSGEFSSLHPGYFVVFSGIFDARRGAEQAVAEARQSGYGTAYAREIAP